MTKFYLFLLAALGMPQLATAQIQLEYTYPRGYLLRTALDVSGETYLFRKNYSCDLTVFDSMHNQKLFIPIAPSTDCSNYIVTEKIMDDDPGIEVVYYWLDAGPGLDVGNTFLDDNGVSLEMGHGPVVLSRLPGVEPKLIVRRTVLALPGPQLEYNYGSSSDLRLSRTVFPVDGERYILHNIDDFAGFQFYDAQHILVKTVNPLYTGFKALNHISQHYFNQDVLLEFFGSQNAELPDAHGNCCRCEVVQENGNVLFSMPAQSCRINQATGCPDRILVQRYDDQQQWQTVVVDAHSLQPVHTFEGRVSRYAAPDGSEYYLEDFFSGATDLRIYDDQFGWYKTVALPNAWNLGHTRGQFSKGNAFEFFFTTKDFGGQSLVRCINEDGAKLYEFPDAQSGSLDRQPGMSDKFILTYSKYDSISVYRFDQSTSVQPPLSGSAIVVSPNPFREMIHVRLADAGNYRIRLFTADGRLVCTQDFLQTNFATVHSGVLAPGVYFVQVEGEQMREMVRVVRVK